MITRTDLPFSVRVVESLPIPLPDGTILSAKAWLPETATRVSAVLEYLPYRKRDGTRTRDQGMHMYLAGHGYACIRLDIRGMGDSQGLLHDEYTTIEQQDGVAAIAWIAAQDFCDGQVAMIGISWSGFNGLQIAALQPPALKTIITLGSTDDRYATDVHYIGGCVSKDNVDWSATMMAQNDLPPDPEIVGPAWHQMWLDRIEANEPWAHHWMAHQRRDDYWQQGSICQDFSKIEIPVYAVSGWADNYSEAVPRLMANLTCPRLGLVGPWAHSFPHDVTVEPAIGWLQEALRWLDHWLKGCLTGIMDEPMLRVWMQDPVPPLTCYTERPGRWVGEPVWPSPAITNQILPLNPSGRLGGPAAEGRGQICSPLWVGLGAGEVGRYGEDAEWPGDQREEDAGSMVFTTQPLTEPLEILGAAQLHLTFASDKPNALVAVRLNDVAPNGQSTRVALGVLNLTHRDSHEFPEPLRAGQISQATVDIDDIAHHFAPGHRIAVSLSTTYWPIAWPSPDLATLTVLLGQSHLTLPVRPPRATDARLRPFDPPEQAPNTPSTYHQSEAKLPRRVTRDLITKRMTVDFPRWTYAVEMTDIKTTVSSKGYARFHITDGDPLSAETVCEYHVSLKRPEVEAGHHSLTRMTCDASHFHLTTELQVSENGTEIHARTWSRSFPRDHV
ncbi:MAG: CocE/NonD family hydrolase [bacterium]